jgi:putative ABC transport system substrate-binding protein
MKKVLCLVMALMMIAACCVSLASCKNKAKYTVGICQIDRHPALDAATKGFKDVLIEAFGEDVAFLEQNGAGSPDTCTTILDTFVTKNVDLILANATPVLQVAQSRTTTIPILGTSITEYGTALNIPNFSGTVGGNISGTSDLAPLDQQAQMILDLVPGATKIGLLYCSAEANSQYQVNKVAEYLRARNKEVLEFKFSDSNDVQTVAASAADQCDAIYIPTDNAAASNAETIHNAIADKKIPVITGESGICAGCGVATLSIDYYDLGRATGEMAVKILKKEANIAEMPIAYTPADKLKKLYNKAICQEVGIDTADLEAKGYSPLA